MALWPRPYAAADPPLRLRPASGDLNRAPRRALRSRTPRLPGPDGCTKTAPRPSISCPTRRPSTVRTPTTANYYDYSGDPFFQERVEALFSWIADADTPTELYHLPLMRQTAERLVSIGLCSPAALAGASWEEVLCRWDSDLGVHHELRGPGDPRTALRVWHQCASNSLDTLLSERARHGVWALSSSTLGSTPAATSAAGFDSATSVPRQLPRAGASRLRQALDDTPCPTNAYSALPEAACGHDELMSSVYSAPKSFDPDSGHFLASIPLSEWNPAWVAQGLTADARLEAFSRRTKDFPRGGLALFLNNVYAFWLSHLPLGQIHLAHITAHVLLLLRLAEEHSTHLACQYELELLAQLRGRHVLGQAVDLTRALLYVDHDILDDLPKRHAARRPLTPPRISRAQERAPKRTPARRLTVTSDRTPRRPTRPYICFAHHPADGLWCDDDSCHRKKEHLDTTVPEELDRWLRAHASHTLLGAKNRSQDTPDGAETLQALAPDDSACSG